LTIQFGTDGWRALMSEDFTAENVKICAQAVCDFMSNRDMGQNGLIIGYDTRFNSDFFAKTVAEVAVGNQIPVILCDKPCPTPVLSYNLVSRECGAGVVITASHNSKEWNGFKFKPSYGGSASPEIISEIETYIANISDPETIPTMTLDNARKIGLLEQIDPEPTYLNHIAELVNLGRIRNAGLNIAVDSMHGAGSKYFTKLMDGGTSKVVEIRSDHDPNFPNMIQPEPIEKNLGPLKDFMVNSNYDVGLATDGDADRLGLIDEDGNYISTLHAFSLICKHLLENLKMKGPIIKSLTMTNAINKLGTLHEIEVIDTPVGFKYLGPVMMEENAIAAGEESGGYGFTDHIPERDGILSGLMILELMAITQLNPSDLIEELENLVGTYHYDRRDIEFNEEDREKKLLRITGSNFEYIGDLKVVSTDERDGLKLNLEEDAWALIRFSGTEPLIRIYAEASTADQVEKIVANCSNIVGQ